MRARGRAGGVSGGTYANGAADTTTAGPDVGRAPLLVYDGDCGFCSSSAEAAQRYLQPPVEVVAYQNSRITGATLERAKEEVVLLHPDGERVWGGADAAAVLLLASPHRWAWPAGWLLRLPGVHVVGAAVYRIVARNRHRIPGGTPTCQVTSVS